MPYPLTDSKGYGVVLIAPTPSLFMPSNSNRRAIYIYNADTVDSIVGWNTIPNVNDNILFQIGPQSGKHFFTADYGTAIQGPIYLTTVGAAVIVNGADYSDVH